MASRASWTREWVGLENYRRLFDDAIWWAAVRNTVLYAVIKLAVELPLALVIALVLNTNLRGVTFFRTVGFLPVITSIAVVSLAFTFFFSPLGGPFNTCWSIWAFSTRRSPSSASASTPSGR